MANHRRVLIATSAAVVALAALVPTLRVNDQYFEYFSRALPIRTGTEFAVDHLTGVYQASFSLEAGEPQGVADPEYLATMHAFAEWLEARPAVAHVNSFSHTMKRLNMNMHGDDPAFFTLPDDRELAAQYLLLYELSLPYGLDLNDQIDVDKSAMRVDATFGDVDAAVVEAETAAAEAWLQEHGTPSMKRARGTGPSLMFSKITRRNIASMIWGTGLGFVLIALILTGALKSVRMGVISLIPNIVPTLMAFGFWALFHGEVNFAVSVIAGGGGAVRLRERGRRDPGQHGHRGRGLRHARPEHLPRHRLHGRPHLHDGGVRPGGGLPPPARAAHRLRPARRDRSPCRAGRRPGRCGRGRGLTNTDDIHRR